MSLNHLGDRGEAIRRAGSVRDDVVLGRIVLVLIDAEHDREVLILRGGGDNDFLHRAAKMFLGLIRIGEFAGGLENNLSA